MPRLSVVVPFYGVEKYVAECLDSLRAQTFTDFEVVLVDDGSPDGSREIVEPYVEADHRFKLVTQENQGLGPARNTGVAHATGEYLAFVDSDDVVAPRAYSLMVDALDLTGSDFCAGNARRFSSTDGTRQSWTHAGAFARTRHLTNIRDLPILIRDRMVWNKVYRRSFWDDHGYAFPAIRYEDYPVTLKAHLDAAAVDLHSEHVYYWRDREGGDSITQQVFSPGNARDRVASAHLVLDLLTGDVPRPVADAVHAYFVDVDLVALAGALVNVPEERKAEMADLAQGLARRIPLPEEGRVARLARLVHQGLLSGDLGLVTALSRWRQCGDTRQLVRDLAHERQFGALGPVLSAVTTRRERRNPLAPRRLKAELTGARVDREVHLTIQVLLREQFAHRVSGRVTYRTGDGPDGDAVTLPTTFRVVPGGLELDVTMDAGRIAPLADPEGRLHIALSVATALRWEGQVKVQPEGLPPLWRVTPGLALQARRIPGTWFLGFERVTDPVVITGIDATPTGFVVDVATQSGEPVTGDVVIGLPYPSKDFVAPIVGGRAEIDVIGLQERDQPDNPVTREVARSLGVRLPVPGDSVEFHGTFESDAPGRPRAGDRVLPTTPWESLRLPYRATDSVSEVIGDEIVTVRATIDGTTTLHRKPAAEHLHERDEPTVRPEEV